VIPEFPSIADGTVTDSDGHKWLGDKSFLVGGGGWRVSGGGTVTSKSLEKRKERVSNEENGLADVEVDSDEDEEVSCYFSLQDLFLMSGWQWEAKQRKLEELSNYFIEAGKILKTQAVYRSKTWINSIVTRNNGAGLGKDVVELVKDIWYVESTSWKRLPTWPWNKIEA
jgi:hypothetical protein